jgi:hypothetical protein
METLIASSFPNSCTIVAIIPIEYRVPPPRKQVKVNIERKTIFGVPAKLFHNFV